jgi:hypothetical protein
MRFIKLESSFRKHNLESIATSTLDNHGLVRGVPKVTLSASTGVGGDGRATRARVNLSPRGTEVVNGASTVVKLQKCVLEKIGRLNIVASKMQRKHVIGQSTNGVECKRDSQ